MSVESFGASEDLDCVAVDGLRSFFRSLWIDRGDILFCSWQGYGFGGLRETSTLKMKTAMTANVDGPLADGLSFEHVLCASELRQNRWSLGLLINWLQSLANGASDILSHDHFPNYVDDHSSIFDDLNSALLNIGGFVVKLLLLDPYSSIKNNLVNSSSSRL